MTVKELIKQLQDLSPGLEDCSVYFVNSILTWERIDSVGVDNDLDRGVSVLINPEKV